MRVVGVNQGANHAVLHHSCTIGEPDILSCEKCENFFEVVVYGEEKDNLASVGLNTSVVHASVGAINPSVDTRR
jgi:hypothetical protein